MRRRMTPSRLALLGLALVLSLGLAATASASAGHVELKARLSGANEVPAADPDGTGRAEIDLKMRTNEICWAVEFNRIGAPNRAHIHAAPAGSNGGIVAPLFELVDLPADPLNDRLERGRASGCATADPALIEAIAAKPADYYVNLHNTRYPAGAIRGQLGG